MGIVSARDQSIELTVCVLKGLRPRLTAMLKRTERCFDAAVGRACVYQLSW
jgi:hypothetical protein